MTNQDRHKAINDVSVAATPANLLGAPRGARIVDGAENGGGIRTGIMVTAVLAVAAIAASFACRAGGGGGGSMCDSCGVGDDVYGCNDVLKSTVCAFDEPDAETQCRDSYGAHTNGLPDDVR